MSRWSPASLSTIRAAASSARRGIEIDARLPRHQHRLEPRDRRLVSQAPLGRYDHVEAVGRGGVIDQGGTFSRR